MKSNRFLTLFPYNSLKLSASCLPAMMRSAYDTPFLHYGPSGAFTFVARCDYYHLFCLPLDKRMRIYHHNDLCNTPISDCTMLSKEKYQGRCLPSECSHRRPKAPKGNGISSQTQKHGGVNSDRRYRRTKKAKRWAVLDKRKKSAVAPLTDCFNGTDGRGPFGRCWCQKRGSATSRSNSHLFDKPSFKRL